MPAVSENLDEVMDSILDDIADEIFTRSQENLVRNGSMDEGTLLKTANVVRHKLEKEIVYPAPYAEFVEYGSHPHRIYSGWLEGWVKRKLGVNAEKARSVAFAVAKKIEKEGVEPKPFLRPALEKFIAGAK